MWTKNKKEMKNKQYDKEQPRRRFNKKVDGPTVMEMKCGKCGHSWSIPLRVGP